MMAILMTGSVKSGSSRNSRDDQAHDEGMSEKVVWQLLHRVELLASVQLFTLKITDMLH
jgi:hypothetical protein